MGPQNLILILIFYMTFVLFGTVMLMMKYLTDIKDCNSDSEKMPHTLHGNSDELHERDPWNINEHDVRYDEILYDKKRRSKLELSPIETPVVLDRQGTLYDMKNKSAEAIKNEEKWGPHKLGIIVPYRNRFEELRTFVPHIHKYLTKKQVNHKIYIINQADKHRFNRASLVNVGFLVARNESCDYIAMHDVDLLPLNEDLNYGFPMFGPFHVSAPHLHPKYHYKTFVGGILILSVAQFEEVNGLSNRFWGWGREDDELYARIMHAGFKVERHGSEIKTGNATFQHEHDSEKRPRDYHKTAEQKKVQFKRDYETGVDNVKYEIMRKQRLDIDGHPCTVIDVSLHCDLQVTPWCDLPKKKKKQ